MFLHFDYYLPIPHSHYVVGGAHHLEKVNVMWDKEVCNRGVAADKPRPLLQNSLMWDHLLQPLVWDIRT